MTIVLAIDEGAEVEAGHHAVAGTILGARGGIRRGRIAEVGADDGEGVVLDLAIRSQAGVAQAARAAQPQP